MNKKMILVIGITICLILSAFPIEVRAEQTTIWEMLMNLIFPKGEMQPELEYETEHIKILNPVSKPTVWGRWIVEFETKGKGDLEIEAYQKTYFQRNVEFLQLYCGDELASVERHFSGKGKSDTWTEGIDNGKIIARDWECSEKGKLVLRILQTGHHYLKFSFLGEEVYAENWADCTGTDVVPCHCCDVADMWVNVTAPSGGGTTDTYTMTYWEQTGVCDASPFWINESWNYTLGYTFCPTEGQYTANVTANASGGDTPSVCNLYENETSGTSGPLNLYTVSWDGDENWCDCSEGATGCSGGSCWGPTRGFSFDAGTTAECCGDDSGENYLTGLYGASIENPPASTDACCNPSTDCVDADTCYALSGTADVDSNADDDVCSSSNTWVDCTTTGHCDPAGEYAEGESSQTCYGGTDCAEACTSNDCIYTRNNGFSDCDLETACTSGNCMQDTEYAGTAGGGACDNADGCICNTCGTWDLCIPTDGCPFDNDWDEVASDCYDPADQGGNCFASSGDTDKDVDNDGDNDWCSSGTWYDCQTDAQCLKGATQYLCVDNDCDENITEGGSNTTCDSSNPCLFVENSTGFVARFDQFGNVDVKGSYSYDQGSLSPPDNSFIIHNSGGTPVLYIDEYGNLATTGRFIHTESLNPSGGDDFIIKDSGGNVQGYIDAATGNMYFKNDFHYYSDF
ncbi:MAG: hypothetical protein GTN76_07830 [Candidatus Aenigmarchaeota archaeon]|nr:hypothetical protein [Candidatus Aenigmarchaeota archaeon]